MTTPRSPEDLLREARRAKCTRCIRLADALRTALANNQAADQSVVALAQATGCATGHGDTVDEMIREVGVQIVAQQELSRAELRTALADVERIAKLDTISKHWSLHESPITLQNQENTIATAMGFTFGVSIREAIDALDAARAGGESRE